MASTLGAVALSVPVSLTELCLFTGAVVRKAILSNQNARSDGLFTRLPPLGEIVPIVESCGSSHKDHVGL